MSGVLAWLACKVFGHRWRMRPQKEWQEYLCGLTTFDCDRCGAEMDMHGVRRPEGK